MGAHHSCAWIACLAGDTVAGRCCGIGAGAGIAGRSEACYSGIEAEEGPVAGCNALEGLEGRRCSPRNTPWCQGDQNTKDLICVGCNAKAADHCCAC